MSSRISLLMLACFSAAAQDRALAPLSRVVLHEWIGSPASGTLLLKAADESIHRCAFSNRTYFERDHKRALISSIQTGALLEVLSERIIDPPRCRALIVRVVVPETSRKTKRVKLPSPTEFFMPRGNVLLTGVIVKRDEEALLLRTRRGDSVRVSLRADTRYYGGPELPTNQPVQIRAGKTFESELEAFSITWGDMLRPPQPIPPPLSAQKK